jgi:hypothetical protein
VQIFHFSSLGLKPRVEELAWQKSVEFAPACGFQDESSVQQLIDACIQDDDKLYLCVSSPTIKDKPVQIRPWRLSDADFVLDASMPLDPRKTVFVGGVPRPLKAGQFYLRTRVF